MQISHGPLRMGGGLKDRPSVVGKDAQPARHIGRMVRPWFEFGNDAEVGTNQCRANLGDELFARALGLVPGVAAQIAANPLGPRGPMDFMPISA